MLKTVLVMIFATFSAGIGETFLSYGMRSMPEVSLGSPSSWPGLILVVLRNYHVTIGVFFMGIFFYLYLATLSWADLSIALPITSLSFVFGVIFAKLFLHETVSWYRWVGTIVIMIGVALVTLDQQHKTTELEGGKAVPVSENSKKS